MKIFEENSAQDSGTILEQIWRSTQARTEEDGRKHSKDLPSVSEAANLYRYPVAVLSSKGVARLRTFEGFFYSGEL